MSPAVLEAISSFLVEGGEEPLLLTEGEGMGRSGGGGRFGVGQGRKEEAKEKERVRWLSDEAAEGNARGAVEEREEGERLFSSEWYAGEMRRRNDQGKYSLALTYWERLLREGIRPCPAAYTQALRACRFTGEMELALELLVEMREDGAAVDLYAGREGGGEGGREDDGYRSGKKALGLCPNVWTG
jgi:hypothetical protein